MVLFAKNVRKLRPNQNWLSQIYTRHESRYLTGDRLTPLTRDTLTGRILSYLSDSIDKKDDIITETAPKVVKNIQIDHALLTLSSLRNGNIKNRYQVKKSLKALDIECCRQSNNFTIKDTLSLLRSFTNIIPHRVTNCQYFKLAIKQLMCYVDNLPKNDLVQLIFFIGFLKKSIEAQNMMKRCLKQLDEFTLDSLTREELCIICNSSFKTATKIKNKHILDKIKSYINGHLDILKDSQLFITLIKSIRHNRSQDDDLINTVTCTIFFNKTVSYYNFPAICHILAFYSDYLYYDENILKLLTETSIEQLKKSKYVAQDTYLDMQPRAKDIKRFLWALSNLNYSLIKSDITEAILPQIEARIIAGEFKNDPETLVEIILYLWIMNYKAVELIKVGVSKENVAFIKANQLPVIDKLNLLLTCIYFEDRALFNALELYPEQQSFYNMDFQKEKRPDLVRILKNLKNVDLKNAIRKFELSCQVPCINIIGIIGLDAKNNRVVNIEVLDNYTLTKNNLENSTGLMALKLRILEKYDDGLVVIDAADLENLNDQEIQDLLLEDLNLILNV